MPETIEVKVLARSERGIAEEEIKLRERKKLLKGDKV